MVPISTIFKPDNLIISGILNPPPISIDSDLETNISFPLPKLAKVTINAKALLLNTAAFSAPVIKFSNFDILSNLEFLVLVVIFISRSL